MMASENRIIFGRKESDIREILRNRSNKTDDNRALDIEGKDFNTIVLEGSKKLVKTHGNELKQIFNSYFSGVK